MSSADRLQLSPYNIVVDDSSGRTVVFNGVTGAVLRLAKEEWTKVVSYVEGGPSISDDLTARLLVGQMLASPMVNQRDILEERFATASTDEAHLGLTIVASLGCNFACPYCFEEKHPELLSDDTADEIINLLSARAPTLQSLHVTWFGGEPLLGLKKISELSTRLISVADKHGVTYSADIITNGYLLDAEACKRLAAARVGTVQVGLDGPPETHNTMRPLASGRETFDRILDNLKIAADYFAVSVRMNVTKSNQGRFAELCEILVREGLVGKVSVYPGRVTHVSTNPSAPSAEFETNECLTQPEFALLEEETLRVARRHGVGGRATLPSPVGVACTALRRSDLVIGSDGTLWKCWNSVGDRSAAVGHLTRRLLLNPNNAAFWNDFSPFKDAQCRDCIALPVCMGGCAHEAIDERDRADRCSTFRVTFREQVQAFADAAVEGDHGG